MSSTQDMLFHQKCEEKRQQYVKDLCQVQMKVQTFLANPISNEKLTPKVIEETEEDADDAPKEIQMTFVGVSTQPQLNRKRSEVALIDFTSKKGENSPNSPRRSDLKANSQNQSFGMNKASPRLTQPQQQQQQAKAETGRKGETGRTNASTAVPATGRVKLGKAG